MLVFAHDSDLHFRPDGPRKIKQKQLELLQETSAEFVIVTGDLTQNGYNGRYLNFGLFKFRYGGKEDQLDQLKRQYVNPMVDIGKEVYLCAGNHDRGTSFIKIFKYSPVRRYIRKRHGGNVYNFQVQGLNFVVMGEFPANRKWLKRKLKCHVDQPFVIAFHFNLEGKFSDWWSQSDKDKFYRCIKGHNILAILVGHRHVSGVSEWHGFRVISSAKNFSLIYYNPKDQVIEDVSFSMLDL